MSDATELPFPSTRASVVKTRLADPQSPPGVEVLVGHRSRPLRLPLSLSLSASSCYDTLLSSRWGKLLSLSTIFAVNCSEVEEGRKQQNKQLCSLKTGLRHPLKVPSSSTAQGGPRSPSFLSPIALQSDKTLSAQPTLGLPLFRLAKTLFTGLSSLHSNL